MKGADYPYRLQGCPKCGSPACLVWHPSYAFGRARCINPECEFEGPAADTAQACAAAWNALPFERKQP